MSILEGLVKAETHINPTIDTDLDMSKTTSNDNKIIIININSVNNFFGDVDMEKAKELTRAQIAALTENSNLLDALQRPVVATT